MALWSLCDTNSQNQDSVRESGGVAALVRLLAPAYPAAAQQVAVGALVTLTSENGQCRDAVKACGGVAALEGVLARASSPLAREWAAAALRNLGHV